MAKKKTHNICGESGNFHRKAFAKFAEENNIENLGPAEIKKQLLNYYKDNLGKEPNTLELNQIYDLGITKYRNEIKNESGERKQLTKNEKIKQEQLQKNDDLAKSNHAGRKQKRKYDRGWGKKFDEWLIENNRNVSRSGVGAATDIKDFLEHLKATKNYKESTYKKIHDSLHSENEHIFQVKQNKDKATLKAERKFTSVTKNRRLFIDVDKEHMENFNKLAAHTNKTYMMKGDKSKTGTKQKLQRMLNFDAYMAQVKGYSDHNQIDIHDVEDFFKYLKSDKMVKGNEQDRLSNKTAKGYKTAINEYARHGKWMERKIIRETSVHDLGVGKAHTKVVQRAASIEEVDKALALSINGTTKNGSNSENFLITYSILMEVGLGLRSEELLKLTVKQVADAFTAKATGMDLYMKEASDGLLLTDTKGRVPRIVPASIIDYNKMFTEPCKNLLIAAEKLNLKANDNLMLNVFPELKELADNNKFHLAKQKFKTWLTCHRHKFQDADRLPNRAITRINDNIEKKADIQILKGDITSHSFRHTFASRMFEAFDEGYSTLMQTDKKFQDKVLKEYTKERRKKNKDWVPNINKIDYYKERGYYQFVCKEVAKLCGHSRYEISETYCVVKDKNNKLIGVNLESMQQYELGVAEDGSFYTTKLLT